MTGYLRMLVALVVALMATVGEPRDAEAEAEEWIALAVGVSDDPTERRFVWAFEVGASAEATAVAAVRPCAPLAYEAACATEANPGVSCVAFAASECTGSCTQPTSGIASGSTRNEAMTLAVERCEANVNASAYPEEAGTCRVSASGEGEPGVVCRPQVVCALGEAALFCDEGPVDDEIPASFEEWFANRSSFFKCMFRCDERECMSRCDERGGDVCLERCDGRYGNYDE